MPKVNNIDLDTLNIGDRIIEIDYGTSIKSTIKTKPLFDNNDTYTWESETDKGETIEYLVNIDFLHYAPKVYLESPGDTT